MGQRGSWAVENYIIITALLHHCTDRRATASAIYM